MYFFNITCHDIQQKRHVIISIYIPSQVTKVENFQRVFRTCSCDWSPRNSHVILQNWYQISETFWFPENFSGFFSRKILENFLRINSENCYLGCHLNIAAQVHNWLNYWLNELDMYSKVDIAVVRKSMKILESASCVR